MIVVRRGVQRDPDRVQQEMEQVFRALMPSRPRGAVRQSGLWRPPLEPGEWRSIGLFQAANETEIRKLLDSLPLHIWMKVTITPLTPHPNDPQYRSSQAKDHSQL